MNLLGRAGTALIFILCFGCVSYSAHAQAQKLSTPQRQAAMDCFRAIRKLVSAIEVGPSFVQYTDRLIDTKAEIDQKSAMLGSEPIFYRIDELRVGQIIIKDEITESMTAFMDARELWRLAVTQRPEDRGAAFVFYYDAHRIYNKYGISIREPEASYEITLERLRKPLLDDPLDKIWVVAVQHLQKAEQALSSSPAR
jgi:hypothetical protein